MSKEAIERAVEIEAIRKEIHKRFPDFTFPTPILEPIFFGRFDKTVVEDRKLIMDADTGDQWDVVSDRYDLIPHEIVVSNLLKSVPKEFGTLDVSMEKWSAGAGFKVDITFPDITEKTEIVKGDKVRPRISAYSSYNRSIHYGIESGAEQLVCGNGLVAFVAEETTKHRHIISVNSEIDISIMTEQISQFLADFSKTTDLWRKWADTKLSLDDMEEISISLPFSEKEREKMMELPLLSRDGMMLKQLGKEATLWDLNSAATQMAKHEIKSIKRSIELETSISKAVNKWK